MADLIESLKNIHESVTFGLHALQHISVGIRRLMERQESSSTVDELGFGSGPKWYHEESEFVWERFCRLQEYTNIAMAELISYRPFFTKANGMLSGRHGTDPIVRIAKTTAASWHAACAQFLARFEFAFDSACEMECVVEPWRDLLTHENCPIGFKSINMLLAIRRAVDSAGLSLSLLEEWNSRLEFEFAEATEVASDPAFWADEDKDVVEPPKTQMPLSKTAADDGGNAKNDAVRDVESTDDADSDAHSRIRGVYEWAVSNIPGADSMTIPVLLESIQSHPAMTSDFLDAIPDKPDAFGKALNRAGIYRYDTVGARKTRQSRRPKRDAT